MRLVMVANLMSTIPAICAMFACADGAEREANGLRSEGQSPSPGVAAQRLDGNRWKPIYPTDFNRDGMADVLWNNAGQNLMAVWLMNDSQLLAPGPNIPGPIGDGWEAISAGDFDYDGMADVFWYNSPQNLLAIWLMKGSQLLAPGPVIPGPLGDRWVAVTSAADFNFDGMNDVVLNNPRQNLATVWLMNGTQLLAPGPNVPGPIGDGWIASTTADFNSDGMADILWNNAGQNLMAVWLMNGTELLAPGPNIPGPIGDGWVTITALDFNFDGMADVLWHNAAQNLMAVWLMNDSQLLAPGPNIPGPLGDGWVPASGVADFNFDGMADVLWGNAKQDLMATWLMNGSQFLAPGRNIPGPLAGN
ncbi:FG-GAP repeat domain-containing protein [Sorangium sp. So ce128]|uniref:FG-GAP repeat domain-containing protein n=1 Tax=Sorangium sp. So ce128 TaxID=3133281 RepID=UPI003F60691B